MRAWFETAQIRDGIKRALSRQVKINGADQRPQIVSGTTCENAGAMEREKKIREGEKKERIAEEKSKRSRLQTLSKSPKRPGGNCVQVQARRCVMQLSITQRDLQEGSPGGISILREGREGGKERKDKERQDSNQINERKGNVEEGKGVSEGVELRATWAGRSKREERRFWPKRTLGG